MLRLTDQCSSSTGISSEDEIPISALMISVPNARIASSVSSRTHPMSRDANSSDYTIIKYFLEQHHLKQVNSPRTSNCCPYPVVLSYLNSHYNDLAALW